MKLSLGTLRKLIAEEAWVPSHYYPDAEPLSDDDEERLGTPMGLGETDDRMMGDGAVDISTKDSSEKISDHLVDEELWALGEEHEQLRNEMRNFFLQRETAEPAKGFYSAFDMAKDHMGTDDLSSTWYRSPGRAVGTDGDPYRSEDPYAQLGFRAPENDTTATHPAAQGKTGTAALNVPQIWQLTAGGNTSAVLGAGAKSPSATANGGAQATGDASAQNDAVGEENIDNAEEIEEEV